MKNLCGAFICGAMLIAGSDLLSGAVSGNCNDGWKFWCGGGTAKAGAKGEFVDGKYGLQLPAGLKKEANNIQLGRKIELESGKAYELTFKIKTDSEGEIKVGYLLDMEPWTTFWITDVKIMPGEKDYRCKVVPMSFGDDFNKSMSLRFFLGAMQPGTVIIWDISVKELNI